MERDRAYEADEEKFGMDEYSYMMENAASKRNQTGDDGRGKDSGKEKPKDDDATKRNGEGHKAGGRKGGKKLIEIKTRLTESTVLNLSTQLLASARVSDLPGDSKG